MDTGNLLWEMGHPKWLSVKHHPYNRFYKLRVGDEGFQNGTYLERNKRVTPKDIDVTGRYRFLRRFISSTKGK